MQVVFFVNFVSIILVQRPLYLHLNTSCSSYTWRMWGVCFPWKPSYFALYLAVKVQPTFLRFLSNKWDDGPDDQHLISSLNPSASSPTDDFAPLQRYQFLCLFFRPELSFLSPRYRGSNVFEVIFFRPFHHLPRRGAPKASAPSAFCRANSFVCLQIPKV